MSRPLEPWLLGRLSLISQRTKLTDAIRYALTRWADLCLFLEDGRIELDSNIVERSERDADFVASVEFLTLGITSGAIAPVLPRLSYRRVALTAVALALFAQDASIFSASLASLALLRGAAGVGEGPLWAVSLSIIASHSRNPDKVYGYFQFAWALGSVPLYAVGGQLTDAYAHRGILALVAGVTLALTPLLLLIPESHAKSVGATADPAPASPLLGAP